MASADNSANNGDSGSKDRATVALVDAKVDGLKDLIRAEFANVKEDVKALAAVVSDVIKQGVQLEDHERRIQNIESGAVTDGFERRIQNLEGDEKRDREWKRVNLPSLVLGCVGAIGTIYAVISTFHL